MKKNPTPDTVNTPDIATLARRAERAEREIERIIAQAWPDPDSLAMLAAQERFAKLSEAEAVRAALGLRQAARDAIAAARENSRQEFEKASTLPTPKQWPATLADFYKLVMRCKEEKDNLPRFKQFLHFRAEGNELKIVGGSIDRPKFVLTSKPGMGEQTPTQSAEAAEKAAERQLVEYQAAQFNQEAWYDLARDYLRWWDWKSTESKRRAGRARAAKAAADKKARGKKISIAAGGVKVTGGKAGTIKLAKEILEGAAAKDPKPDFQKKSSHPT